MNKTYCIQLEAGKSPYNTTVLHYEKFVDFNTALKFADNMCNQLNVCKISTEQFIIISIKAI